MDLSTVKTLLESQERAYKNALDIVVKQMTERTKKLESTVADLTSSLEYSQREIDDLKSLVKEHDKEKQTTKARIEQQAHDINLSKSEIKNLEERCNYMEDYSRRHNIRISGLEELDGLETWEQTAALVLSLLEDKMQLPGLELERAHRVGQRQGAKPRNIVARFSRYCDREAVMRNAKKLKGTNIYINDDLCAASHAIRNAQMPQLKEAKAQGKIAFFRHTKLIIREKSNEYGAGRGRGSTKVTGAAGGSALGATGSRSEADPASSAAGGRKPVSGAPGTLSGLGPVVADGAAGGSAPGAAGSRNVVDPASGAAGGREPVLGASSGVVHVETAGVWNEGSDTPSLSLPSIRPGDRRKPPTSLPATPQHREGKKEGLRSSTKK